MGSDSRRGDLHEVLGEHRAELALMRVEVHADDELPQWIHLAPAGPEITGRDGRAFAVDDPSAVIDSTAPDLPLLIDWDHDSMWGSTKAAGWLDAVEYVAEDSTDAARPEPGFWGRIEAWTPEGADDVRNLRYRQLSPVIRQQYREPEVSGEEPPPPLLLSFENVALTNRPNLRMVALNADGAQAPEEHQMTEEELASLLALLSLEDGASGADILAAVQALIDEEDAPGEPPADNEANRLRTALRVSESALTAARAQLAEFAEQRRAEDVAERTAQVETAIAEGRALEAHRDDLVRLATSERDEDREMFERLTAHRIGGAPMGRVTTGGEARPRNRASSKNATDSMSDVERHLYVNLTRGLGWSHDRAMNKLAETSEGN